MLGMCLLCLVWALLVASQTSPPSCPKQLGAYAPSRPQIPLKGTEPQVCVSQTTCCTKQMELTLKNDAVNDMKSKILKKYEGTKSSLISLHNDLKNYFEETIQNAFVENTRKWTKENKLPEAGRTALSSFFGDLQNYLTDNNVNLRDVVKKFFKESFPILYQHSLASNLGRPLTKSYAKCLKDKYDLILPFGKHPDVITARLIEALKPVQVFLESLQFGARTIEQSKGFNFTSGCDKVLLQMSGCSLCKGFHNLKPCHRFCTDVLKHCLGTEIQLQKPWGEFIDASNALATGMAHGSNLFSISNVMVTLHQDMGQALVYSVIHQTEVLTKTSKHCSKPQYLPAIQSSPGNGGSSPTTSPSPPRKRGLFPKMEIAKQKLHYMRNVFSELVRYICVAASPALSDFEKCWNGKDKGRYTGSPNKPTDFQPTPVDVQKLKGMVDLIRERTKAVKKVTPVADSGGEGSVSGSGDNKVPNSGNCGDDEDCETSGLPSGEKPTHDSNTVADDAVYFVSSTPNPDVQHGGDGGGSNVGARGGDAASIRQNTLLLLVSLLCILVL